MKFLKLGVLINFIMKLERVRNLKHYLIYFSFFVKLKDGRTEIIWEGNKIAV